MSLGGGLQGTSPEAQVNKKNITFGSGDVFSVLATDILNDPIILKRFVVTPDPLESLPKFITSDINFSGVGRRLSGASNLVQAFASSDDNRVTWNPEQILNYNGVSFQSLVRNIQSDNLNSQTITDVAFILYSQDGISEGEIKEQKFNIELALPFNYTVEEV